MNDQSQTPVDTPAEDDWRNPRIDRNAFEICDLDSPSGDVAYWLSRTPAERFAGVRYLRWLNYGVEPDVERLERVLEVVDQE